MNNQRSYVSDFTQSHTTDETRTDALMSHIRIQKQVMPGTGRRKWVCEHLPIGFTPSQCEGVLKFVERMNAEVG